MKYVGKKILTMCITLLLVSFLVFLCFSVIPGDPALSKLGTEATPEMVEALRKEMGLDRPFFVRYGDWLWSFVKGDMGKIQQVLYNLIDNATKFSHNNTAITIEASIRNGKVLISVKDSGIGIPRDSIKKIWDRFYKTDLSRGKDKRGTGLGLAIVKEIVQAHNENINVISTEGVGTEFIFTLPLLEKE